ncbi:MAG: flagellar basal body P-ring protein FlgI [Tepidisphaeraceae bacterium]
MLASGCSRKVKNKAPVSRYTALPEKKVPEFLKDTIFERTELANADPYLISGFGLVANLDGTGNSDAPNAVRDYMIKQMQQHRFGSAQQPGFQDIPPERVLRDPRFALVRVDGYLPPGVREGDYFDINISALNQSTTTSLARGDLYQTELRTNGASVTNPGGAVNVWARAQGPVFVNPAYALGQAPDQASAKQALRRGVVMDGGRAMTSRPLALRLLQPQRSMARRIEMRIDEYFQEVKPDVIAAAQDEGIVYLYVPHKFRGDWQHFAALVSHLYLRGSEAFSATKAKQLAEEAVKPGAPLGDITYCWEGLGPFGLPYYRDLMSHEDTAVAFAAARAAAFLRDPIAPQALARIAKIKGDQWQLDAIRTLGALPNSPSINELLRPLLNSDQALVRTETYKVLAAQNDPAIFSTVIKPQNQPLNEKFVLDVVRSDGSPIIHATRTGIPRIAIIGDRAQLNLPITFSAMGGRLTISSAPNAANVTIFYRAMASPDGGSVAPPVKVVSRPDLAEIVARLGGEGGSGLNFNYGDVVSILNALTDAKKLSAMANGQRVPASFVLQELPFVEDAIFNAPALPDARPQADEPGKVGMAK